MRASACTVPAIHLDHLLHGFRFEAIEAGVEFEAGRHLVEVITKVGAASHVEVKVIGSTRSA